MGQCCTKREKENNKFKEYIVEISDKKTNYKIERYKNKIKENKTYAVLNGTCCLIIFSIIITSGVSVPIIITLGLTGGAFTLNIININNYREKLKLLEDKKC